jgi:hypothetical protein
LNDNKSHKTKVSVHVISIVQSDKDGFQDLFVEFQSVPGVDVWFSLDYFFFSHTLGGSGGVTRGEGRGLRGEGIDTVTTLMTYTLKYINLVDLVIIVDK